MNEYVELGCVIGVEEPEGGGSRGTVGRHTMANLDGFTVEQLLRGIYDISHVRWNKIVQIPEHKAGAGVFCLPECEADVLALAISLV